MADKQFGLILPKSKLGASSVKKPVANVFGQDSSSEDEETKAVVSGGTDWMKRKIASGSSVNAKSGATGLGTKITTKHALMKQKALKEDPTVFQYDEVFDQMEAAKIEQSGKKKVIDRKPKYIANLLKQAEIRNQDDERRKERKVQKEREAEGDEFADKEKFVTSAYRKKMEEMQKLEEEDKKRQAMEEMLDVTKQKDMSGFYRHLFRQTMGEEKGQKSKDKDKDKEKEKEKEVSEENLEEKSVKITTQKNKPSQRSYRQRQDSELMEENTDNENDSGDSTSEGSSDDEKTQENTKEVKEEGRMEKDRKRREELRKQKEKRDRRKKRIAEGRDTSSEEESGSENENEVENNPINSSRLLDEKSKQTAESNDKENNVPSKAKKAKIDIWKKVTMGQVYEAALERYLMRKSERGSRFPW